MLLSKSDLSINESYLANRNSVIDNTPLDENFSFISLGLECMAESNKCIRDMMIKVNLNEYIKEDMTDDIIDKVAERFSFSKIVNAIIEFFKKAINKFVIKAKLFFSKLLGSNAPIKKYEKLIKKYNKSLKVDFDHYNYTHLDADMPSSDLNMRFAKEYEDLLDDLKDLSKNTTKEDIINALNIYHQELQKSIGDDYYNHLRGEMVLEDDPVTKDRFVSRLWKFFRNNEESAYMKKIQIPPYEIQDAYERFSDGRKWIKELETSKAKVEASCNKMKQNINRISPIDFMAKYIPIDYDIEYALDRILKLKCGQLTEMCNIFSLAFSHKIEAIKEALIQDRKVLYAVVADIMVNPEEVEEDD